MLFISQLINFNIMKGLVNHPMGLVNIIKKLNFSDLVAIDWLKLLFGIILAILCLKLSIFIEIKESKSRWSELIIRKPFTISFYTKYYFVKYCPYILLIPLLFTSVLSSMNNEHLAFFNNNFEINLKSYKKDYDYQSKVLENHHETFNSVRGLTDEKRAHLDEDEKMELDYYEETELEEQKNILDESRIRYEHLLAFSNRDKDPKKYYNLEKEAIKNHPLLLYNTMLRDMELSDKTIPLNIDYVSEYEKRNLPTPKTFLGPIFSNFDSNNYIKLDYLIMEYFYTGLIKNNDAFAFLYNFFHIKLGLLLMVIISLITNVFLWKRNHIKFKLSLKEKLGKVYIKSFIGSFVPSLVIFLSIIGIIFLFSGLFYGFGNANHPVAITFKNSYKFISLGKYLLLNVLLSSLGISFITSLLVFLSLIFKNKTLIGLYFVIMVIGIILAYFSKYSFISPMTYLDSDGILSGFLRNYHGRDSFNLILGLILLAICALILNIFSLKNLRRTYA